jgi:phosphoglycolate phosphatase
MVKNLILDWSGTLADDLPSVLATTNRVLTHFGRGEMTLEEFRAKFRLPYTEFYDEVLPEVPLEKLQHLYLAHFPTGPDAVPLLDHAREFLEYAAATGRRMVLLSSAPLEHFEAQARTLGVRDFFEHAYCGVVDKRRQIVALLEEMNMDPDETAFIGDMRHDVEAGKEAGVLTVATATGYDSMATLMTVEPDVLVPNLSRLPRFLGGWQAREAGPPIATVGALITNHRGEVLMVRTHKWSDRWGIPGGKIKRGETCEAALRREIMEETGLELGDIHFVMVQDCIEPPEFERSAHFLLMNYVARCLNEDALVTLNDEAEACQWLPAGSALKLELNHPTRVLIEESIARGFLPSPP